MASEMVIWFTVFKLKWNFNFHIMDQKIFLINKKLSRANVGFASIFDLLNHNISALYSRLVFTRYFYSGYSMVVKGMKKFADNVLSKDISRTQWRYLKKF